MTKIKNKLTSSDHSFAYHHGIYLLASNPPNQKLADFTFENDENSLKKFILALYFKYYKLIVFVLNTPFILKYECYHTDYFVYYFIQIVKRCQTMSND